MEFSSGDIRELHKQEWTDHAPLAAGAGTTHFFNVTLQGVEPEQNMLLATCMRADGTLESVNEIPMASPEKMVLPAANVQAKVAKQCNDDGSVDIELLADGTALYVMLSTLAHGRFSDNVFAMPKGKRVVKFLPIGGKVELVKLKQSLR